jgi:peptidoglycan/LPS O-acetylase OafA/YrhL
VSNAQGSSSNTELAAVGYRATAKTPTMKRTFVPILAALAAAALFAGLVHAVLVTAHVSDPAATTVYGLTPRRLWATTVAMLALVGVIIGGRALRRSAGRIDTGSGGWRALVAGLIAVVGGGLNLAFATGGPGTGNGVVGGAAALVMGLVAMVLGGLAISRSRRTMNASRS